MFNDQIDFKERLTPNFQLFEFFQTEHDEALLRKEFLSLSDNFLIEVYYNIKQTAQRWQSVRDILGFPIGILSGWRSKRVNDLVGGVPGSTHKLGQALDPALTILQYKELFNLFDNGNKWAGGFGMGYAKAHGDIGQNRNPWRY